MPLTHLVNRPCYPSNMVGMGIPRARALLALLLCLALLGLGALGSGCGDLCSDLCSPDAGLAKAGQCFCQTEDGEVFGPVGE